MIATATLTYFSNNRPLYAVVIRAKIEKGDLGKARNESVPQKSYLFMTQIIMLCVLFNFRQPILISFYQSLVSSLKQTKPFLSLMTVVTSIFLVGCSLISFLAQSYAPSLKCAMKTATTAFIEGKEKF